MNPPHEMTWVGSRWLGSWEANLLTGRFVFRIQPQHLHRSCLESANLAVFQSRCYLRVVPFRRGILPDCPSLDTGNREAEVGFEPRTVRKHEGWDTVRLSTPRQGGREAEVGFKPRTFRSVNPRSSHFSHLAFQDGVPACAWLETFGKPGSMLTLIVPSGSVAARQKWVLQLNRFLCCIDHEFTLRLEVDAGTHTNTLDSTNSARPKKARFINRRGSPKKRLSDRGSNCVGAELELRQCLKSLDCDPVNERMIAHGIEWHFNPLYSRHRGGQWERQIPSIRRVLSVVSREQVLTDESLSALLTEVERILNNHPLVPVYGDPDSDVLTPSHLLLLRGQIELSDDMISIRDTYTRCSTTSVPSWHATRRKHEGSDTLELPTHRRCSGHAEVAFQT
ncbi:hypothetical protein T265_05040 [Opisthorchis viverrini]|uniref:Uncharacterized protein n=1 Tax=Opisthorchis viverrini TaxID=6198 RepID=A0A074ZXJ0_OPIVI|nr:hypothetical protein T265_05040 [Opisthorchis viverrini]KER28065.1 hypothetical protein T265_05040 [Opisthorchis viverrini]